MPTKGVLAGTLLLALLTALTSTTGLGAQKGERPPHGQDRLPGPALSPAEAVKKMKVPEGFTVEVVASEPAIVNPVAMTFDEKGRVWLTESLEYPRRSSGPGRDRVKVLEDTDGDGTMDRVTVFAEGLNIPSGIAVGHGGVWVANSPDILFYKVGPDGKAAGKPEVVVTGFGRSDTHELPNSLTWGPDGWLYGWNGVFNHSHVKYRGKEYDFTCAIFRIHPKTRDFEIFCEGTSNPWGIAIDPEGSFFASACVIDHLWHLVQTGYYHRQGGPYPPFTWKLDSIVKHRHQKAAYCGVHYFDSDAYPPQYRDKLYMGNIHGGCINVDVLKRDGSSYLATPDPDFLTANDAWFMPVSQKTGPDGCLYILDWYDRYHCYQDANRDPAGIDRLNGRLYRVRYKDTPRAPKFDLAKESDDELIRRLYSANVYFRDIAQRLLSERATPQVREKLSRLVLDDRAPRKARMHGLFAQVSCGPLDEKLHLALLGHKDPAYRAWGVRAAGNAGKVSPAVRDRVRSLVSDESPDVLLQLAIAARKVEGLKPAPLLLEVLAHAGEDKVIPAIVWQNLHPLLEDQAALFVAVVKEKGTAGNLGKILPRAVERILARRKAEPGLLVDLLGTLVKSKAQHREARTCLTLLADKVQTGEISVEQAVELARGLKPVLDAARASDDLRVDATLLAATLREDGALKSAGKLLVSPGEPDQVRLRALEALVSARAPGVLAEAGPLLGERDRLSAGFRGQVLSVLGKLDDPKVAGVVLEHYPTFEPDLKPKAVELLTQRTAWARALLKAVGEKKVPADALNVNQVRRLLASKDAEVVKQVKERWGTLREERNPEREQVVKEMGQFLKGARGDEKKGREVFRNVCGQCHKIHGEGVDVGPDITSNGRATFEQLLSNVFDPSLVIGAGYQAVTVTTTGGRVLTGLLVEDSRERVVLKLQGGKQEVVPRKEVEEVGVSKASLMPEGLEKQLKPQEVADLFAFITLDRPPEDPRARRIPGSPKFAK